MSKYGVEHFHISLLEETNNPEERERYWIEKLNSFKYGYNATIGGDGKKYIDWDLVINTYKKIKSQKKTAQFLNISETSVHNILIARSERIYSFEESIRFNYGKIVNMYNLKAEYLRSFPPLHAAADFMIENKLTGCKHSTIRTHISEVCNKKRKTAANFIWRFGEE